MIIAYHIFIAVTGVLQADPGSPVLAAGDPERINEKKCEEMGGISYHINVVKYMVRAGDKRNDLTMFS